MSFLSWKDEDVLGIEIIDKQHKTILDLTNKLYELNNFSHISEAKMVMRNIVEELNIHFDTENQLMRNNNVFDISHKLEHDRYLEKVRKFNNNLQKDQFTIIADYLSSFRNWFHNHLIINDRKLAKSLKEIEPNINL